MRPPAVRSVASRKGVLQPALPPLLKNREHPARLVFAAKYIAIYLGLALAYFSTLNRFPEPYTLHREALAQAAAALLQLAGQESRVAGTTLLYRGIEIHIVESCDGVVAGITLVAAVFAFPFPRGLARGCSGRSRALRRCRGSTSCASRCSS